MPEVTDDIKQKAAASAKKAQAKKAREGEGFEFGAPRTRTEISAAEPQPSDIPVPIDPSKFGPTAFSATPSDEVTGYIDSQEYVIDEERATFLHFTAPGANLPKKNLYTVKGIHKDGRLVQLPNNPGHENNAGGDPSDMLALRRYQSKGIHVLYDFETNTPVYCATWDCWAKAREDGFCCDAHKGYTLPDADQRMAGNVTTTHIWNG